MNNHFKDLYDKKLVPLRLDSHTVIFVPKKKANNKYKKEYIKRAEESKRMALNLI